MRSLKAIVLILLSVCFSVQSYSQGSISIHFGPSVPLSDFASDDIDDEDAGGAAVGLNIGLQCIYPLFDNGLGLFCGIDFNYNGLANDVKDDVEDYYEALGITDPDFKFYKYINVPVSAGLNYSYQDGNILVFANAGPALNFLKITDMEIKALGQKVTTEMDLARNIGYRIGGGIMINENTYISVDYLSLGEHDIKGQITSVGYSEDIESVGKVDLLTLTLGFGF